MILATIIALKLHRIYCCIAITLANRVQVPRYLHNSGYATNIMAICMNTTQVAN